MCDEIDNLLSESVNLAESFLMKNGELYPCALALTPNGESVLVHACLDDENPDSDHVIPVLRDSLSLRFSEGTYILTAIMSDVKLHDRETGECRDAIRVAIEDRISAAIICYVPYRIEEGAFLTSEVIRVASENKLRK